MPATTRVFDREGLRRKYRLVRGKSQDDSSMAFWRRGILYVRADVVGTNPLIQDVAAFETLLEKETPKYYAQLEAFRLAGKLGVLDRYFDISEKRPFSAKLFRLAKLESP